MAKPRRKSKSGKPPVPPVGRYVLYYQAPDGTPHDPPIPLDQRLTDNELRELVNGIQAKLKARQSKAAAPGITFDMADELPGGIKLKESAPAVAAPSITVGGRARKCFKPGDIGAEIAKLAAYSGPSVSKEEIDQALAADEMPLPHGAATPPTAIHSPPDRKPLPSCARSAVAEDGWADAAATIVYKGLSLFTGACVCGAGVILGGWAALKSLPWLATVLGS
jgi:hypothetical protein